MNIVLILLIVIFIIYINYPLTAEQSRQNDNIKTLTRQAARWSIASEQDKNPLIRILHANYGAGYLWALLDISTPEEIEKVTGIDFKQFKDKIISIQDSATKAGSKTCPNFSPGGILSKIAGDE